MPRVIDQYIFGNSLVNFAGGSGQTNIPFWLDQFAEASGGDFNVNGGYGFLRQFADRDQPASEWGFAGVGDVWDADTAPFDSAAFDAVMIAPANFIQDRDPDQNYPGDVRSPLDATLDVITQVQADQPGADIFIYQGWADMGALFPDFVQSEAELEAYYQYASGPYQAWFDTYVEAINARVPDADVQVIPVNEVLIELVSEGGPLADLGASDLFVDTAPHGTETTYYLASMITYSALYGAPVSANAPVGAGVHPLVASNLPELSAYIHAAVTDITATSAPLPGEDVPAPGGDPDLDDPGDELPPPPAGTDGARDDSFTTDGFTVLDVLANDAGADALFVSGLTQPQHGVARIVDNLIEYRPDDGYSGPDSFTYETMTADGVVTTATVELAVEVDAEVPEPAPSPMPEMPEVESTQPDIADPDQPAFDGPNTSPRARRDEDQTDGETIRIDVLANDIDRDGDEISLLSVGSAANGTVSVVDGLVEYTPDEGFVGLEPISYAIIDERGAVDGGRILVSVGDTAGDEIGPEAQTTATVTPVLDPSEEVVEFPLPMVKSAFEEPVDAPDDSYEDKQDLDQLV